MSDGAKEAILTLDSKAKFFDDGTFETCLDYMTLQDIFNMY